MMYAIKYKRVLDDEDVDNLIPVGLVQGDLDEENEYFSTKDEIFCYIDNPIIDGEYIIGCAKSLEDIRKFYNFDREYSDDEVINFFWDDEKAKTLFIKDGVVKAVDKFNMFYGDSKEELYQTIDGENCVIFNVHRLNEILSQDPESVKEELRKYPKTMASFQDYKENYDIEMIKVQNGHVVELDKCGKKISKTPEVTTVKNFQGRLLDKDDSDFTVQGLYDYLSDRIIGHEKELKRIATKLISNYKYGSSYGTECILVPGPTGTGKTATFKCASQYLNVPFKIINAINLNPEGIEGTAVEDIFADLMEKYGVDAASKAILVFDEFDKLGVDTLDTKNSLVNIFLKILEGGEFPINKQFRQPRVYDTTLASKVCLGAFNEAYKKGNNGIGFNSDNKGEEVFDRNLLVSRGYFSKELLDRFQLFIPYSELTDEDKKRILLESKLSKLLLRKEKFEKIYGIEMIGLEEYAEGVIEALKKQDTSIRDLENMMADTFVDVEYEVETNLGKYKTLKLDRDSVSKRTFDLH